MMRTSSKRAACWGVVLMLSCGASASAIGSELQARTAREYEEYVGKAKDGFLRRAHRDGDVSDQPPLGPTPLTGAQLWRDGRITKVPGGLVHHWAGAIFIPAADLDRVLAVAQAYDDYAAVYGPIVRSRRLAHDGNVFRVFARVQEDAGVVSAVLDVWSEVRYERWGRCAYSLGAATDIRQVKNPGHLNEEHFPAGRDSGYLWRANTFTRFVERDGGVYVELETVGLSRRFPPFLGWIIEPIARRLGRASIERTLTEFRNAVLANGS